jgi:3-dehydroquinate synthase
MFEIFNIQSSSGSYSVELGTGQLTSIAPASIHEFIIIDLNVSRLWPQLNSHANHSMPVLAIEENKTLSTCAELIEGLRAQGANRSSSFCAFGGGIIQDLATFTASVYMRGIQWTYVPTTLLGMVDSCIGGKSSINVGPYKNIAGNYYPPKKIIIDIDFCKTLDLSEFQAGLCEAIKICFAARGDQFEKYLNLFSDQSIFLSSEQLLSVISLSLATKKQFIENDEFDFGPRLLLNFGHTFGHAIEAATDFKMTHGIAVGMGMLAEIKLAMLTGVVVLEAERVKKLRKHIAYLLNQIPDMTKYITAMDLESAICAFRSDKKHRNDAYAVIMPNEVGFLEMNFLPNSLDTDTKVLQVFEWLKSDLYLEGIE